ncbi:MAG TPA: hypothetical protein VF780_09155 [Nitrosospira sp.]
MCSPKPPKPDSLIGQAAKQNADIAQQQLDVAKQQLAWEKDRAAIQDPLLQKIVDQQIAQGDTNAARADEQWQIYKNLFQPVEQQMVNDAMGFDSPERKDRMAGQAAADVTQAYTGALDQNRRQMERMGINPNSGRFSVINNEMNLARARDTAGAMNQARTNTELQGMAMRQGVAQFGRNMPNTGLAADAAALNAGNSAAGNLVTKAGLHNAGLNAAQSWFGGAAGANTAAGNLGLGQYQGQLNAWQQASQNSASAAAGLGNLIGQLGSAYMMKPVAMRKGGIIRMRNSHGSSQGSSQAVRYEEYGTRGLSSLKRFDCAAGGVVQGPGTATSDSIPATVEGVQPIRLSNGEAVLNAEAVKLLGEDFIHRVNNAAFVSSKLSRPRRKPGMAGKTVEHEDIARSENHV